MVGKMAQFLIYALVTASALIFPIQGEAGKYYPLEQGRSWTYRVTKTDIMGEQSTYDFTRRAIAIRTLDGQQVVPLEYTRDGTTAGWVYVIENDAGIMWYAQQSSQQGTPTLLETYALRYPIREGRSWDESMSSYLLPVTEKVPYTTTISSLTDSVMVAAGRFDNCLRLRMEGRKRIEGGLYWGGTVVIEAIDWHCIGVGFTKSVVEQRIEHPVIDLRATKEEELLGFTR